MRARSASVPEVFSFQTGLRSTWGGLLRASSSHISILIVSVRCTKEPGGRQKAGTWERGARSGGMIKNWILEMTAAAESK